MKTLDLIPALLAGLLVGCHCMEDDPGFGPGSEEEVDSDPGGTGDPGTGTKDTHDTGEDPGSSGFDDPGDINKLEGDEKGDGYELDLVDLSGDSNKDQEFFLILVNDQEEDQGYQIWYTQAEEAVGGDEGDSGAAGPPPAQDSPRAKNQPVSHQPTPFRQQLRQRIEAKGGPGLNAPPPPMPLAVGDEDEFHVRSDISDDSQYEAVMATLWALGDTVAIWVDQSVNIDHDVECDGIIDYPAEYDAYGFDNCDLETIAGIVDKNIMVNLQYLLGDFSDVNEDGRVSVLITPVLNGIPRSSDDEDEWANVLESYADPEVDLNDYHSSENPGSDEQEVIFVFAPDPYGYLNPDAPATIEEYTGMALAAQIAQTVAQLIMYNYHVIEMEGETEEGWVTQGIAAVAADLVGFGAIFYDDAWDYADATHLYSLADEDVDPAQLSVASRGAQYLFFRWLVDTYGEEILTQIVQTDATGADNVVAAVQMMGDSDIANLADLALRWQGALLTTGVTDADGGELADPEVYPPYADAVTISAPTDVPETGQVGVYYGANGYQQGINVHGVNIYMEGGTTDSPEEIESLRVTMGNSDHFTYVPGFYFYGYAVANYGAQVVRLADIEYDAAALNLQGGEFAGSVIRWNDPEGEDIATDAVYSSLDTSAVSLPALPEDGSPVYAIGELHDGTFAIYTVSGGESTVQDVYDTDRWLLDLSGYALGDNIDLVIWLDRHYEDTNGNIAPYDPWFALAPVDWVPTAIAQDPSRALCPADGADEFSYPESLLEHLFYQEVLSYEPLGEEYGGSGGNTKKKKKLDTGTATSSGDFDPCGEESEEETSCVDDYDLDGVPDADEPIPENFMEQVLVRQCTLDKDLLSEEPYSADWFDADTTDDDESPTMDRIGNTGGMADSSGEEAYMEVRLEGGYQYLLVVGGGTDSGTYEITIQSADAD